MQLRKNIKQWPRNLIKQTKQLKRQDALDTIDDLRTTILLSGIKSYLPADLRAEVIDEVGTPKLSRYMKTNSPKPVEDIPQCK